MSKSVDVLESDKDYDKAWLELSGMSDFISQSSFSRSREVTMETLTRYLQNPEKNLKQIRDTSRYLTKKHGILQDVLRMVKSLPTLKYSLLWSDYEDLDRNKDSEIKVQKFLDEIDVVTFIRDGLYEAAELGTVVTCLRSKSYVQFLDIDELRINRQRNGKWVVEYDLKTLDSITDVNQKTQVIDSLPDEVTMAKYLAYKKGNSDEGRYVELSNCHLIRNDGHRNFPYGFPVTMGAWISLLQKEIIDETERSVADRLIKQIVVLSAGYVDEEKKRGVPKEILSAYFKEVSSLLEKREKASSTSKKSGGVGTVALPHFLKLEALSVDTTMFKQELYDKINGDIFLNLGVSPSLIGGLEGNYASANINNEKFFSFVITMLEQFETIINDYLRMILPENERCRIVFDRATVLDKDKEIKEKREFYMQTGTIQPYVEALFGGGSFPAIVSQARYEREVLKTEDIFYPPKNAYTSSGNESKEPKSDADIDNENTMKTKQSDGNNTPSPSDK